MKYKPFQRRPSGAAFWGVGNWLDYDAAFEAASKYAKENPGREVELRDKEGGVSVIWRLGCAADNTQQD